LETLKTLGNLSGLLGISDTSSVIASTTSFPQERLSHLVAGMLVHSTEDRATKGTHGSIGREVAEVHRTIVVTKVVRCAFSSTSACTSA
jgi:hypothetical protein